MYPNLAAPDAPRHVSIAARLDQVLFEAGAWFATLRDRIVEACVASDAAVPNKRVYYLSLEFLIGRLTSDALNNLGLFETTKAALAQLDADFPGVVVTEAPDTSSWVHTGFDIAPVVFGGNVFGWTATEAESFRLLDAFVDAGIRWRAEQAKAAQQD